YKANDGTTDSNVATVKIITNHAPTAKDDFYIVTENNTLNAGAPGVLGNDSDPEGDPLTAGLVSGPSHGSLTLNSDGSFVYTPASNFLGSDSFTYKANDGMLDSNTAVVNMVVNAIPVANNDSYSVNQDATLSVTAASGLQANDSDVDADPLFSFLVSSPSNGSVSLNGDGSFSYTPNAGFYGKDSFTYQDT